MERPVLALLRWISIGSGIAGGLLLLGGALQILAWSASPLEAAYPVPPVGLAVLPVGGAGVCLSLVSGLVALAWRGELV